MLIASWMLVQNLLNHYLNITKYPCNVTIGSFSFLNIIKMLQWIILCFNFSSSSVFPDFQKWNYCFGRRKKLFLSTQFMLCINKHSIFYLFVNTHFQYQRMKKTSNIHLLIFKICLSPISTKTSYFILLYSRSSNDWKHSVFLRYTMKKKLGGRVSVVTDGDGKIRIWPLSTLMSHPYITRDELS